MSLTSSSEQDARSTIGQPCVCFGVVALGVLGLVAGALVATTNCFMGFVPFAALLCAAVLSGPIFCRPVAPILFGGKRRGGPIDGWSQVGKTAWGARKEEGGRPTHRWSRIRKVRIYEIRRCETAR